jgi:hypothetical protein
MASHEDEITYGGPKHIEGNELAISLSVMGIIYSWEWYKV